MKKHLLKLKRLMSSSESPRWRIEHSQNITPIDQKRFVELNIIPSMQPSHAIGDLHFAIERLGLERIDNAYAWRNLIDQGLIIAGGTDAPVEIGDPRIEFYAAGYSKRCRWVSCRWLES
jgi:predicted amidohydrolase YtcJ